MKFMRKYLNTSHHRDNLTTFIKINKSGLLAAAIIGLINALLVWLNQSWVFERFIIENYGDQQLYFELAYSILSGEKRKSIYTLGYPVFFMIFILKEGLTSDWRQIIAEVIFTQAFIIVPLTFFLIFRKLSVKYFLIIFTITLYYYLTNLLLAPDPLLRYNFLGLVPLSEPLAVLLIIVVYLVYHRLRRVERVGKREMLTFGGLGFLIAFCILVRSTLAVLIVPIFLDLLISRKIKAFAILLVSSFIFFIPQLLWNYWVSHNVFFSGYLWWNSEIAEDLNRGIIKRIYGIDSNQIFSLVYLKQNLRTLFLAYFPLIALLVYSRMWRNKLEILVTALSVANILFYLSYFWSAEFDLIDRFLLPNYLLVIFLLSEKFRKLNNEKTGIKTS